MTRKIHDNFDHRKIKEEKYSNCIKPGELERSLKENFYKRKRNTAEQCGKNQQTTTNFHQWTEKTDKKYQQGNIIANHIGRNEPN